MNRRYMFRYCIVFLFVFAFSFLARGNNLRLPGVVKVVNVDNTNGVATLCFSVTWDNSWRDGENFDGVWVYLKYKERGGLWQGVHLLPEFRSVTDTALSPYTVCCEEEGAFVYRSGSGYGRVKIAECRVGWKLPESLKSKTAEELSGPDYLLVAQGVEMVFVPYGAFYAGDGYSNNSLCDAEGHSLLVHGEEAFSAYTLNGSVVGGEVSFPSSFAKGYGAFWCMKYESSQEQVVSFLNMLSLPQQREVLGIGDVGEGSLVFGSESRGRRNGIVVAQSEEGRAYVFDCNLNGNGDYGEEDDGKTLACNYMTPLVLRGYASWSGLRPMSELEYEKGSRPLYPSRSVEGEYAWNSGDGRKELRGVDYGGSEREVPSSADANVNSGGYFSGPVRCGSFASRIDGGQLEAGSGYWGLMEMSGNVWELCVVAGHNGFDRLVHGRGEYDLSLWRDSRGDYSGYGLRGGSFGSGGGSLQVSDRSSTHSVNWSTLRSEVGFRCVRNYRGNEVISGGTLSSYLGDVFCSGSLVELSGSEGSVKLGGRVLSADFSYQWYVSVNGGGFTLIENASASDLSYSVENSSDTLSGYVFRRRCVCAYGEAFSDFTVKVVGTGLKLTGSSDAGIDACRLAGGSVSVSDVVSGGSYEWMAEGKTLSGAGAAYTLKTDEVQDTVWCTRLSDGGCESRGFYVLPRHSNVRYSYTDTRVEGNNEVYPVVKIKDQCWMAKDMNVGEQVQGDDYDTYLKAGIQKICYNNDPANCNTYGGLYRWDEAVSGENASSVVNQPAYKYTSGGIQMIQGICPDGWHVPSDEEWKTLERSLGMTPEQADATSWRGTDQGTQLKSKNLWNTGSGYIPGTNSSGMNMLPGGWRTSSGSTFTGVNIEGGWWSSTLSSGLWWAANLRHMTYLKASVDRVEWNRANAFNIRCIRN